MRDIFLKELLAIPEITLSKEFLYASMFAKTYARDAYKKCAKTSVEKQIDIMVDIQFSNVHVYDIVEYVNHDKIFDLLELEDVKKWVEENEN